MAERGQVNIDHLDGVVRLREEHEKVKPRVQTLSCWLLTNDSQTTARSWPRGGPVKVFEAQLDPLKCFFTPSLDVCALNVPAHALH